MFNSKYVAPRKITNNCILFVKGDWNDADYITEDTSWSIEDMKEALPYFCILLDLFNFDYDYRHKTHDYNIDIRNDFYEALDFYMDYKENFYDDMLELKEDKEILSDRVISLNEDEFKTLHNAMIENIKDCLVEYTDSFPSYEGWGIHSIKEIYIDYQGNKYDIMPGETLEAFAELMDRGFDNYKNE